MTWQSSNRNTVARDIEEGKHEGRYKDCAHLVIGRDEWADRGPFATTCTESALETPESPYLPSPVPLLREPRCPEDCRFFEDRSQHGQDRKPGPLTKESAPPDRASLSQAARTSLSREVVRENSSIRLFISHASTDATLAELIVKLLQSGLTLPPDAIRCTSVDGYRLPAGVDTDDQIRAEVLAADVVVGIISTASLESLYVAFELGARWGANRSLLPLMAPGTEPSTMKGPLGGKNALRADSAPQLQQLVDDVGKQLAITPNRPATFQSELKAVLALAERERTASEQRRVRPPDLSLTVPPGFQLEHGIVWDMRSGVAAAYCEGCRTGDGKLVQMACVEEKMGLGSRRTYTCPHRHPPITLTSPKQAPPMTALQRETAMRSIQQMTGGSKDPP